MLCIALGSVVLRFEYCGQSNARPLRTRHSPRSAPAIEHVATVRPYRSSAIGTQFTGCPAMKASRSFADLAPHRYCKLSAPRQSCTLSGASMPQRRMRAVNFECVAVDDAGLPDQSLRKGDRRGGEDGQGDSKPHRFLRRSPCLQDTRWRRLLHAQRSVLMVASRGRNLTRLPSPALTCARYASIDSAG